MAQNREYNQWVTASLIIILVIIRSYLLPCLNDSSVLTINIEALLHRACNSYSLSGGSTGADAYLIGKLQFWQFLNFPVVGARRRAAACWPWTSDPNLWISVPASSVSPKFPLIFIYKPTFWRIRQLVVSLRCPVRFKSFEDPEGGFWRGIPGYRLQPVCGRVSRVSESDW